MNYENYIQEREIIENKISELKSELTLLRENFIEKNKEFSQGDKVSVSDRYGTQNGFVVGNEIGYRNKVEPIIMKEKKDGTQSQHRLHPFGDVTIKKIN